MTLIPASPETRIYADQNQLRRVWKFRFKKHLILAPIIARFLSYKQVAPLKLTFDRAPALNE